jgi:DNA-binding NtrC family response regulator
MQQPKIILILDDEKSLREALAGLLKDEGYDSYDMESKLEGYEWSIKNQPGLVISDIRSPVMGGFDFLKLMKSNESTKHIPVVIITGGVSTEEVSELISLGAYKYQTKPYDLDKILQLVKEIFNQRA